MLIQGINNHYSQKVKFGSVQSIKNELSRYLFNCPVNKQVSFGWSKNVTPLQERILDVLSDPKNRTAIVASHTRPDGDAYGSAIGIAGILSSFGVKVYPVIDNRPVERFAGMPSAEIGIQASAYFKQPAGVNELLNKDQIKKVDVAIVTDTPAPDLTTSDVCQLLSKAGKIIIIDHHPDDKGEPTNLEKWTSVLQQKGVNKNNIIYWRDSARESAAEMIGDLDKEIFDESKIKKLPKYNPTYYPPYRLAIAGGIVSDTGAMNIDKEGVDGVRFARLSEPKIPIKDGSTVSVTRAIFNWLIDNCGIKKSDIDVKKVTRINLPPHVSMAIDEMIKGEMNNDSVEVKVPTAKDPFGYIHIKNYDFFSNLAKQANQSNKKMKISGSDIYYEVKKRLEEEITKNKDFGLLVIANDFKTNFSLSIRSYGKEAFKGETYVPGHVYTEGLATKVAQALSDANIGEGGGHNNATGFKSKENVNYSEHALPVIEKTIEEYLNTHDIKKCPSDLQRKIVTFLGKSLNSVA